MKRWHPDCAPLDVHVPRRPEPLIDEDDDREEMLWTIELCCRHELIHVLIEKAVVFERLQERELEQCVREVKR
jgi:hypothetical protein